MACIYVILGLVFICLARVCLIGIVTGNQRLSRQVLITRITMTGKPWHNSSFAQKCKMSLFVVRHVRFIQKPDPFTPMLVSPMLLFSQFTAH